MSVLNLTELHPPSAALTQTNSPSETRPGLKNWAGAPGERVTGGVKEVLKRWQPGGRQKNGCAVVHHSQERGKQEVMQEFKAHL